MNTILFLLLVPYGHMDKKLANTCTLSPRHPKRKPLKSTAHINATSRLRLGSCELHKAKGQHEEYLRNSVMVPLALDTFRKFPFFLRVVEKGKR